MNLSLVNSHFWRSNRLVFILMLLVFSFQITRIHAETVINFDTLPHNFSVADAYASQGLHFDSATVLRYPNYNYSRFPARSGDCVIYDWPTGAITIRFDTGQNRIGGYITGNANVTLRAYDKDGNLIGASSTGGANLVGNENGLPPNIWVGVSSNSNTIMRVVFSDHGNSFTLDDFTFDNSSSPSYILHRANLHSHTNYSDAGQFPLKNRPESSDPSTAYSYAIDHGLQVMAITDHGEQLSVDSNNPENRNEWNESYFWSNLYSETSLAPNFVALRGFEWTMTHSLFGGSSDEGHLNVFGSLFRVGAYGANSANELDKYPIAWPDIKGSLKDFYQWLAANQYKTIDAKPLVAQFNHPSLYKTSRHFNGSDTLIPQDGFNWLFGFSSGDLKALWDVVSLIELGAHTDFREVEIYSGGLGNPADPFSPYFSNEYWYRKALHEGWHVAPTNNEDNHQGKYGESQYYTGIYALDTRGMSPLNAQSSILDALRARRTFSSEDKDSTVILQAKVDGESVSHWMGETIEVPKGNALTLSFNTHDDSSGIADYIDKMDIIVPSSNSPYGKEFKTLFAPQYSANFSDQIKISDSDIQAIPPTVRGERFFYIRVRQADGDLLYSAPIWITQTAARLKATVSLSRTSSSITEAVTITNTSSVTVTNVMITSGSLGSALILSELPRNLGNLEPGGSASTNFQFPTSVGKPGFSSNWKLSGTYTGGSFGESLRVTLP